ncbi:MAG: hypothetical protein INR64_13795 [Caulobacteraceae bacterium]|nr:hypothetical protein [Caulobacter sp.]
MSGGVHYELYGRRVVSDDWALLSATADRAEALADAQALVASGRMAAARVCKEVLDEALGRFSSVAILTVGAPEAASRRRLVQAQPSGPACGAPQDLYAPHAREVLARLLEDWLQRRGVTVFELLHSPRLAEELDASGDALAGAVQRIAIPESQSGERPLHEAIRSYRGLAARAIARLAADGKRRAFPEIDETTFAVAAGRLAGHGASAYRLGGGVAAYLAEARGWRAKLERIVSLAEAAPEVGPARALALATLEAPLGEILGGRAELSDLAGRPVDLGGGLAVLVRLAAGHVAAAVESADRGLLRPMPALDAAGERLAALLSGEAFEKVRAATLRRVLAEVAGPRRLRPGDAQGEIELLRALAGVLGAAAGPRLPIEDVRASFLGRSRRLVAADFTAALTHGIDDPVEAARALVRLAENVTGAANKRAAARWIEAVVGALKFETAVRQPSSPPGARLAALAALQRALAAADLDPSDAVRLSVRIGEAGGWVEGDARLAAGIARSGAPPVARALALLRMASGECAPLGPAAERARAEALRLIRTPELRAQVAAEPESLVRLRGLMAA